MVKTISIECPHCNKTFDVYLSSNTSMIIMNCPLCLVPFIFYKERCFILSEKQLDTIRKSKRDTTVFRILHKIARSGSRPVYDNADFHRNNGNSSEIKYISPPAAFIPGNTCITKDDVLNLRIELETCNDSSRFIERL
jgi:hypothetical protein